MRAAVCDREIRQLIVNLPPRHLKSLLAPAPFQPGASTNRATTRAMLSGASARWCARLVAGIGQYV
jgi:hypothetical protein